MLNGLDNQDINCMQLIYKAKKQVFQFPKGEKGIAGQHILMPAAKQASGGEYLSEEGAKKQIQ